MTMAKSMEAAVAPEILSEEPVTMGVRDTQPSGEASSVAADLDHHAESLDAVAGSEFVDDRIRLGE
jgi:hypothetical protein